MAIITQRVSPNTPITKSLGFDPRGVLVDNVTAYWLYFPQADQYCPPFTMGWSAPFILNMAGYGYMQIQTPFGREVQTDITPNISDYVAVTWSSDPVGYSPGLASSGGTSIDPQKDQSAAVSPVTPSVVQALVQFTAALSAVQIVGTSGKRINLLTWDAIYEIPDPANFYLQESICTVQLADDSPQAFAWATLSPEERVSSREYPLGLPFPEGSAVNLIAGTSWADINLISVITYQVIN